MDVYMIDDIIKLIRIGKIEKGDKFKAIETPCNLIIEYDGNDLVYNTIMGNKSDRDTVILSKVEINTKFIKLPDEQKNNVNCEIEEFEPYCINCGNDDFPDNFNYENHYANGYKYICKDCGDSVWLSEKEHEEFFY
ncbi:hypothetical protein ACY1J9_001334 [Clostridium botulinum]